MLGRANRYHHWEDMLRFKKSGISVYDFGGWYVGDTDQEKLRINDFKNKFGGQIVKNFNCNYCINIKGSLYLHLVKTYSGLMQLPLGYRLKDSLINPVNWLTKQNA
jgi:lipid II:glycine glycyltransferase (peptidoglycan interpeptide bridge formation enzyme)